MIKKGDLYINDNNEIVEVVDYAINNILNDNLVVFREIGSAKMQYYYNYIFKRKYRFYSDEVKYPSKKYNPDLMTACEEGEKCLCAGCGRVIDCSVSLCDDCEIDINKNEPSWHEK